MPPKTMQVKSNSIADKLDTYNPSPYNTTIQQLNITDYNSAGVPCKLVLKIGNSEFVEITGLMKTACIPSIHH